MKQKRISPVFSILVFILLVGCNNTQNPIQSQAEAVKSDPVTVKKLQMESKDSDQVENDDKKNENKTEGEAKMENSEKKVLVVYFSRTGEQYGVGVIDKGNTAIVAEIIAEETGADRFEILPQQDNYPYTYDDLTDMAKRELNENARPAYAGEVPDLSQYDTVFIGAPVWWGDWPMICYSFFENNANELAGKTLIPFSTHEGSGLSGFDKKLSSSCPNSTIGKGIAITGTDAQKHQDKVRKNIKSWLSGLGF